MSREEEEEGSLGLEVQVFEKKVERKRFYSSFFFFFFLFHSECKQDDPVISEKLLTGIYVSCHGSTDDEEERERERETVQAKHVRELYRL